MSQALYRKYRPRGWEEVVGQGHVVQTLRNAIMTDRVGHAYLFSGPRGTGKTTLARILAKAANCLAEDRSARPCNECEPCKAVNEGRFLDLIEMDAASNTGVDDVRELRDRISFSPSQGRFKVYIIDEVHMLSTAAFNALLKTLEEPPPHAKFVLATTEIQKIPATVLSRCQRHEFRRLPVDDIVGSLRSIVAAEGWQCDEEVLHLIARQATGSIRDAQSLLDQLASGQAKITLEHAQPVLGTATSQAVLDILDALKAEKPGVSLEAMRRTLDSGVDPRTLARQVTEYLRGLLWIQMGNAGQVEATKELRERMQVHAASFKAPAVIRMLRTFSSAAADTRGGWQPSLALELAIAESFREVEGEQGGNREPPAQGASMPGAKPAARLARSMPPLDSGQTIQNAPRNPGGPDFARRPTATAPAEVPARRSTADEDQSADETATYVELSAVARAWKEIRGALKRTHPTVDGLLNSCKPVEVQGNQLVLGFQSETVRALMDSPEKLEAAGKAIQAVLGQTLRLRCVVINARGKVPPNIPEDGMIATALNQGGEIVDLQD